MKERNLFQGAETMSDSASDQALSEQFATLRASGVVLVPVHEDKSPVYRAWNRRGTRVRRCLRHLRAGGLLAVIPASAGSTVIDVDNGDWTELTGLYPPTAVTRTPSGGVHLWYRDSTRRRPRTWSAHGCSGDIVSTDAYVVLWEGIETLQSVLESDPTATYPAEMISRAPRAEPGTATPRKPLDHSSTAQAYRGRSSGISRARVPRVRAMVAKAMCRDGLTQGEIAEMLKRSTRTVRSYLGWEVEPASDWKHGLKVLKDLERIERTDRKRLARAAERAEANLVGGIGGSRPPAPAGGLDPATPQYGDDGLDRCPPNTEHSDGCRVHGYDYRHWTPPSVRAVQLALYRLQALANVGTQSKGYDLATRAFQRYLRAISRRSCSLRSAAVEAQAESHAEAAREALVAGIPIVEILALIREHRYGELYRLCVNCRRH